MRDVFEETVADAIRVGRRTRELARAAGDERSDLVLGARQLGPALPLRSHDRAAQAPDHDGRRPRARRSRASTRRIATLWFTAIGTREGQDPYFRHFYKIGLDGKRRWRCSRRTTATTTCQLSPDGQVPRRHATRSPTSPPTSVAARRDDGKLLVMPLEKADISQLVATGWKPPMPIKMKARDGKTDLYGLMFRRRTSIRRKKYPIINNVYPGPQTRQRRRPRVQPGARRRAGARRARLRRRRDRRHGHAGAVEVVPRRLLRRDGRQHDSRSDRGHEGARASGIRGSTSTRPAIWGHSGGGFITADAMFRYPGLLQGRHRRVGQPRPARVRGRLGRALPGPAGARPTAPTTTTTRRTRTIAKNLKGHLLLAHGTMDNNVPPYNTLLVADALIKANKDFDLLMLPEPGARLRQRCRTT